MSDQFVAEIRIFPFNFAPFGWATCDGQLLPIAQYTDLYVVVGTTYGGDGITTFGLPNLKGSAAMHAGSGPGLTTRILGESGGSDTVTLLSTEIPVHSHTVQASNTSGTASTPAGNVPAKLFYSSATQSGTGVAYSGNTPTVQMAPEALAVAGSGLAHNNMQPYLVLNHCIALQGVFPDLS